MDRAVTERIRGLPDSPGIYIFLSEDQSPLYIGKAGSLRKRAAAYLKPQPDARLQAMVREAHALDFVVTDSEAEALLLENNWIKHRKPRYNIRLRDDKTYPYLKLTLGEPWPRLVFTRRIIDDGSEYYGPYLPAGRARKAIKLTQKLFGIRVCRIEIDGQLPRPCLYWDMQRCLGPCVDGLTDHESYLEGVERARSFLSGRTQNLVAELKGQMRAAADTLEFEAAAQVRDLIAEIGTLEERQKLSESRGDDVDTYGVHVQGDHAAVVILVMRAGQVLDRRELFWEGEGNVDPARLLSELLPQIYDRTTFVPKEVHLPMPIEGHDALERWLSERKEERVYLRYPSRGKKADRIELARKNARLAHRRRFRASRERAAAAAALKSHLDLDQPPQRIEGFDVSTLQGSEIVASMVVWEDGKMNKSEYRSFNIRGLDDTDDFASIRQAVWRRYRRRLDEVGEMPDLILVDGGRGQLNAALQALAELGVEDTPIVGLAKAEEEIYRPDLPAPMRLERTDRALQLLQMVRDEAHRFAVSRHRRRRSKRTLRSGFDDLAGIGPKRRRLLVRRFGSFRGVREASLADLQEVLGERLGGSVWNQLHPTGQARSEQSVS